MNLLRNLGLSCLMLGLVACGSEKPVVNPNNLVKKPDNVQKQDLKANPEQAINNDGGLENKDNNEQSDTVEAEVLQDENKVTDKSNKNKIVEGPITPEVKGVENKKGDELNQLGVATAEQYFHKAGLGELKFKEVEGKIISHFVTYGHYESYLNKAFERKSVYPLKLKWRDRVLPGYKLFIEAKYLFYHPTKSRYVTQNEDKKKEKVVGVARFGADLFADWLNSQVISEKNPYHFVGQWQWPAGRGTIYKKDSDISPSFANWDLGFQVEYVKNTETKNISTDEEKN